MRVDEGGARASFHAGPYRLVPEADLEGARESGRRWAALYHEYEPR
jgi:trans-o-hydroxybenzylidenepyruvate hydratase-aldolase